MSALLSRLIDDAALFAPARTPMDDALPAYRGAVRDPVVGRLLCPASRFAELRRRLVPEDLLDLVLVADTGIEELPRALDAVRAEPRVRPSSVEIALPGNADQARAAAVTLALLPPGVPAHIEVRRSPGRLDALDRIAAARDHGAPLGAKYRLDGPALATAAFIAACAERDLPFTCAANRAGQGLLNVLLATAQVAAGADGVQRTLERHDAGGLAADVGTLTDDAARSARRLLAALAVPHLGTATSVLALIRKGPFSTAPG
ncbi:hypothetical protein E1293_41305 [Actinomadura darangshiensis]|uniref:Uncharacterized protein n=1 Tax=Actinomadura darangshiensis TaxID=705336 RepID=A0A4R4ZZS6_9ACTN|nr:hypothetical protein [Actinomadura darangshiensis]TDD64615.1 hypothetical protein E1293_41305 [Actinomadura darangshiensis]